MSKRKRTTPRADISPTKPPIKQPTPTTSVFHDWDKVPNPPRIGHQMDQELISKSALVNWLYRQGWMSNKPEIDLGHDLWVEIYENRRSTGLAVNFQHKSAADIDDYKLKTSAHISYPVDVKDIVHWNKQVVPVLIVVCDSRRDDERYWIFIADIMSQLNATGDTWLQQESIQVLIPLDNRLNAQTLHFIRHRLADHFFPAVAQKYEGIKVGVRFTFPPTPEGRNKNAAFTKFLDTGEPVTIEKEYIADFRLSDWYEQLYGRQIPNEMSFGKASSRARYHFRLEVYPTDGSVIPAQSLELRVAQSGRFEATLSNNHQDPPLVFTFTLLNYPDRQFVQVNFRLAHAGSTVFETRDALLFLIAIAEGGHIQLIERNSGKAISAGAVKADEHFSIDQLRAQAELVKKLCFFQSRFHFSPVLSVRDRYLSDDDFYQVDKFYTICQMGMFAGPQDLAMTYDGEEVRSNSTDWDNIISKKPEQGMEMSVSIPQCITVLDRVIELGTVRNNVKLSIEQTVSFLKQLKRGLEKGAAKIKVSIPDASMDFTYIDWNQDDPAFGFKLISKRTRQGSGTGRKRIIVK